MKQAGIYVNDLFCGILTEDEEGFHFAYDEAFLASPDAFFSREAMRERNGLSSTYKSLMSAVPIHTVCLALPTKDRTSL